MWPAPVERECAVDPIWGAGFVFRLEPRPEADWVNGLVTFDVWGRDSPYPWGRFIRYDRIFPRDDPSHVLTATETWDLYSVLPTLGELRTDPMAAVERIRTWEAGHPDQRERYPATRVLLELNYWLQRN